jgi:hypothetical protein
MAPLIPDVVYTLELYVLRLFIEQAIFFIIIVINTYYT